MLFVLGKSMFELLQLPVLHKLSISHDLPMVPATRPVTGEGDLQGTSVIVSAIPSVQPDSSLLSSPLLTHQTGSQVDPWIGTVPGIFCGCDGPNGICPTPALRSAASLHGCVLRLHHHDFLLLLRGE